MTAEGQNRRTISGYLVKPGRQFKHAFILAGGGLLFQTIVIMVMGYMIHNSVLSVAGAYEVDPAAVSAISRALFTTGVTATLVSLLLAGFIAVIWIRLNHRIFGPLVRLNRQIAALTDGDYSGRVKLRENDEFVDVQDGLNRLAEALSSRHGKQ